MNTIKKYRVIVAGSRDFTDYKYLENKLDEVLYELDYEEICIISGACRGVDVLGEQFAKENGLPVIKEVPDWENLGKSAGFKRNIAMAKQATHCVVFQVNNSKGSQHMINIAQQYNLELRVFHPLPVESSRQGTPLLTQIQKDTVMSFSRSKLGYEIPCFSKTEDAPCYVWRSRLDQIDQIPKLTFSKAKFIEIPQGIFCLFELSEAPKLTKVNISECPYAAILLHTTDYKVKNWDTGAQDTVSPSETEKYWIETLRNEKLIDKDENLGSGHFWYFGDLTIMKDNLEFVFTVSCTESDDIDYEIFNALAKTIKEGCGSQAKGNYTKQSASDRLKEIKPLLLAEMAEVIDSPGTRILIKEAGLTPAEYLTILFK